MAETRAAVGIPVEEVHLLKEATAVVRATGATRLLLGRQHGGRVSLRSHGLGHILQDSGLVGLPRTSAVRGGDQQVVREGTMAREEGLAARAQSLAGVLVNLEIDTSDCKL